MSVERMLCCMSNMNIGGAETFLMKQYRKLDRTKYQMDFCVYSNGDYDDEILALGGKIYHLDNIKSKDFFKTLSQIKKIVSEGKYKSFLCSSVRAGTSFELLAAKAGGAEKLIFRSASTNCYGGKIHKVLRKIVSVLAHWIPNVMLAPSTQAAEYAFGKNCIKSGKAHLLNNGIDMDIYKFHIADREKIRKELFMENSFVIGHVGRFHKEKNHRFMIDILKEALKKDKNVVMMFVGSGELEEEIKKYAEECCVQDSVRFLGFREDIPELMSAMDVFLFPSEFEGMPNSVIEAQALSLHCVVSDSVTNEVKITDLVEFKSLNDSAESWVEQLLKYNSGYERKNMKDIFKTEKYDIDSVANEFVKYCFVG